MSAVPAAPIQVPAARVVVSAPARRRALLWVALVLLIVVAQSALVALTIDYEANRVQDRAENAAAAAASEVRRLGLQTLRTLQSLAWSGAQPPAAPAALADLFQQQRDWVRIEWRDASMHIVRHAQAPGEPGWFEAIAREALDVEVEIACSAAARANAALYSRSYFVPLASGHGQEVIDLCVPALDGGVIRGYVVATVQLAAWLDESRQALRDQEHEFSFVDGDGARLARTGAVRGAGVYRAERVVELPGLSLQLRADAVAGSPRLIPNLATALVMGLSALLFAVVLLLARDVRRRARAEAALGEALAFRKAMEDSLATGLRAGDLQGRLTYANPAFCAMVGYDIDALRAADPPPYWPADRIDEYRARQAERRSEAQGASGRNGYETEFVRRSGERFPVMVFEAPLVDAQGRHTGWMSAAVDLTERRRAEDLARQQQERLQASARLATMGEMASLLSHELNQPLAAIASYANGSMNLIDDEAAGADEQRRQLRQAISHIAEQAERAGRVIKSVHGFVRRRERSREAVAVGSLFDAVLPLVRLQARKNGTRIELDLVDPDARVMADRTMIEQVLLNLARNAIQAMELDTEPERRVLSLRARVVHRRWVAFSVVDQGPGIAPDIARRLFTPFFTTRIEGMGLGLSLCRTVVEQHGGALDFETRARAADGTDGRTGGGTEFRFTLPLAEATQPEAAPA
ncbi:MAG: ATP-binding protein [Burkholderiaceae bacterium]